MRRGLKLSGLLAQFATEATIMIKIDVPNVNSRLVKLNFNSPAYLIDFELLDFNQYEDTASFDFEIRSFLGRALRDFLNTISLGTAKICKNTF